MIQNITTVSKYTLGDVYALLTSQTVSMVTLTDIDTFSELVVALGFSDALIDDKETIIDELFMKYILPNMLNEYVLELDEEDNVIDESTNLIGLMLYDIINSYDKYATIITKFEAVKDTLTDNLDSLIDSNVTKYNDTPQEQGNYTADEYTTTITSSTATRDNQAKELNLNRIVLLQEQLKNTYLIWFNQIFKRFVLL